MKWSCLIAILLIYQCCLECDGQLCSKVLENYRAALQLMSMRTDIRNLLINSNVTGRDSDVSEMILL